MLITPPTDTPEVTPIDDTPVSWEQERRIKLYLNVKPWKCPECGIMMFGRCMECVYCLMIGGKHTSRPAHYTKGNGA